MSNPWGFSTCNCNFLWKKVTSFLYNKSFIAFDIIFAQGQKAKARFQQLYFPNILANLTDFFLRSKLMSQFFKPMRGYLVKLFFRGRGGGQCLIEKWLQKCLILSILSVQLSLKNEVWSFDIFAIALLSRNSAVNRSLASVVTEMISLNVFVNQ